MPDKRGTVLVVEDEPAMSELMSRLVEREGFEAVRAASAAEALSAHARSHPVAMLLDWGLPDSPGSEVCRQVREQDAEITIIFITGREDETSVARALDAGADDYVVKPVRGGELIARLEANLRRVAALRARAKTAGPKSNATQRVSRFGSVEVDLGARRLTVDGHLVPLGPLEFALLEYLVSNAGIAVSRDQIMSAIYGYEADIGTERVDLLARRLRSKLGSGATGTGWITAVPGYGYRLEKESAPPE